MSTKQHIIELNGQRYDALTGAIVAPAAKPAAKTHSSSQTNSMDGFSRVPKRQLPHHLPEKSKTLMRAAVRKPVQQSPPPAEPATNRIIPSKSVISKTGKHVSGVVKSPLVSRFGANAISSDTKNTLVHHPTKSHSRPAAPHDDPFAHALATSTSHQEPKPKKPRVSHRVARKLHVSPRLVSGASFVLAFFIIGGFFAYQNIPGLTMRLASSRSGVGGSLPGYQPAGFSLNGSVAYKPGQITISYHSNSDDRSFKVSQAASDWDSQSLLQNYVAVNRRNYQTVQDKGKTVYIYDEDNATWVDGGIWYRIEGESKLSSDQLLHIAASL